MPVAVNLNVACHNRIEEQRTSSVTGALVVHYAVSRAVGEQHINIGWNHIAFSFELGLITFAERLRTVREATSWSPWAAIDQHTVHPYTLIKQVNCVGVDLANSIDIFAIQRNLMIATDDELVRVRLCAEPLVEFDQITAAGFPFGMVTSAEQYIACGNLDVGVSVVRIRNADKAKFVLGRWTN